MSVKDAMEKVSKIVVAGSGPLWQGPEGEGPQGGVTQSQISAFLGCRERFRVKVIEGLRAEDQFNKYLEYGNMWHVCEEALAGFNDDGKYKVGSPDIWKPALKVYCQELLKKYPLQQEDVDHWYRTCKAQFPHYVAYWAKHKDVEQRTPLMQEQVFDVPYKLPSGRVVRLRGKFDSVDLIGKGKGSGIFLMENKTKGDVDRKDIEEQLTWDLQTMLYLTAMTEFQRMLKVVSMSDADWDKVMPSWAGVKGGFFDHSILGVRYNVVRRPFSGGRGSIKRNPDKETKDSYYLRLAEYFKAEPEYWFMRWKSEVHPTDVIRFRKECLDPILEAMCWWYDQQITKSGLSDFRSDYCAPDFHWRHPFGVVNSTDEGYKSEVDQYINTVSFSSTSALASSPSPVWSSTSLAWSGE